MRSLAIALTVIAQALVGAAAARGDDANSDPASLRILTNNVENLPASGSGYEEGCKGTWRNLPDYLGSSYTPDIFLVQQIAPVPTGEGQSSTQIKRLQNRLRASTGQSYGYVLSDSSPAPFRRAPCFPHKEFQANAIFYRTSRFTPVSGSRRTWPSYIWNGSNCVATTDPTVADQEDNGPGARARTTNIAIRLRDNRRAAAGLPNPYVTVGSIHWPSADHDPGTEDPVGDSGESPCTLHNSFYAAVNVGSTAGDGLRVFGGDTNSRDWNRDSPFADPRNWWINSNSCDTDPRGGFCDTIDGVCNFFTSDYQACRRLNGTGKTDSALVRRDYIFATRGTGANPGVQGAATLSYLGVDGEDSAPRYSQHRAVAVTLGY